MRRWLRCRAGVALVTTIALGGCGGGDDTPASGSASGSGSGTGGAKDEHAHHGGDEEAAFPPSEADTTVKVAMSDFAFAGIPATVTGRKVLFEVANQGPSEHELVVFAKGGNDAVRGIEPFAKGKTEMLAVALEPGAYTAKCLVKLGNQTHADLGMQTDFTVG